VLDSLCLCCSLKKRLYTLCVHLGLPFLDCCTLFVFDLCNVVYETFSFHVDIGCCLINAGICTRNPMLHAVSMFSCWAMSWEAGKLSSQTCGKWISFGIVSFVLSALLGIDTALQVSLAGTGNCDICGHAVVAGTNHMPGVWCASWNMFAIFGWLVHTTVFMIEVGIEWGEQVFQEWVDTTPQEEIVGLDPLYWLKEGYSSVQKLQNGNMIAEISSC